VALRLEPLHHAAQLRAQALHARGEAQIGLGAKETGGLLGREQRFDRRLPRRALADVDA
jgi:hypothetical protein